jgi:hypothetical protein
MLSPFDVLTDQPTSSVEPWPEINRNHAAKSEDVSHALTRFDLRMGADIGTARRAR